jgi:peptide/nickel transport system permease protein
MVVYLIRRLVMTVVVLVLLASLVASLVHFIPGNPVTIVLGPRANPALVAEAQREMHLNDPIVVQIYLFLSNAVRGNLGSDFLNGAPVSQLIMAALPHTVILAVAALFLVVLVGVPLSVYGARRPDSWADRISAAVSISLITLPPYVAGLLLLILFPVTLHVLPAIGAGSFSDPVGYLEHLILPAIALAVGWIGYIARLLRASMLEVLNTSYVRTARSWGVKERIIFYKYVLKNAVIPTIAILGVGLGQLIGGAIFVEVIFARPGLGTLVYDAIQQRNYPVVQAGVLVIGVMFVFANLLADLSYRFVDPRVRVELGRLRR